MKLQTKFFTTALLILTACQSDNEDVVQPSQFSSCQDNFVEGYTDKISYYEGEKVRTFLNFKRDNDFCQARIFKMNGTEILNTPAKTTLQAIGNSDPSSNGFNYKLSAEFNLPDKFRSGVYLLENQIPIIIKPRAPVDLLVVYPSNTANAYAVSGGLSLYSKNRPYAVSFLRPIGMQTQCIECLKWFELSEDLKIGYIADVDLDDFSVLENAKVLVIIGHSEYWTRRARINFDRFIDQGKHALILSGNTMWWQVRYSSDKDKLICYREFNADPEPETRLKTVTWDAPALEFPIVNSIGADFNNGGYGLQADNGWDGFKIVQPKSPLLAGLNFKAGDILHLPSGEYDGVPIAGWDTNQFPIADKSKVDFHKLEIIGFDKGSRFGRETYGTFIAFQKKPGSGVVINMASYDWCSSQGMGGADKEKIKKITKNAITLLLNKRSVFSE